MNKKDQIVIYQSPDGEMHLDVNLKEETIWLSQSQMELLFNKSKKTISEHINNVYKEGELVKRSTVRKFRIVQKEGNREINRNISHYNLDVIISVGYRVKSQRGTQFRIWANKIVKEYLVKGYVVNEKRLNEKVEQLEELKKVVQLQEKVISNYQIEGIEAKGLIRVITDYSHALDILDDFDHQRLKIPKSKAKEVFQIKYEEAKEAIHKLGEQSDFKGLFGKVTDRLCIACLKWKKILANLNTILT